MSSRVGYRYARPDVSLVHFIIIIKIIIIGQHTHGLKPLRYCELLLLLVLVFNMLIIFVFIFDNELFAFSFCLSFSLTKITSILTELNLLFAKILLYSLLKGCL